ncbi:hypothetical protein [Lactovum odontotermitis]
MKSWGWGFISFAAFLLIVNPKGWQLVLLIFIVGLVMLIRGRRKETPADGDKKDDKGAK